MSCLTPYSVVIVNANPRICIALLGLCGALAGMALLLYDLNPATRGNAVNAVIFESRILCRMGRGAICAALRRCPLLHGLAGSRPQMIEPLNCGVPCRCARELS